MSTKLEGLSPERKAVLLAKRQELREELEKIDQLAAAGQRTMRLAAQKCQVLEALKAVDEELGLRMNQRASKRYSANKIR